MSSINRQQARLQEITRRIHDLQEYSAVIADGSSTMADMMNVPGSMVNRLVMYNGISHNSAMMQVEMQMNNPGFKESLAMTTQGMSPEGLAQYEFMVKSNLYKQAREEFAKREAKFLNQQEKELTMEKERLEASLKMLEADLESAKKARDKGIEMFAPKYVA